MNKEKDLLALRQARNILAETIPILKKEKEELIKQYGNIDRFILDSSLSIVEEDIANVFGAMKTLGRIIEKWETE